jgi:hypothetical protein
MVRDNETETETGTQSEVTSGERLLMGKGVLVIRSHIKVFVFAWTAQPCLVFFSSFCAVFTDGRPPS